MREFLQARGSVQANLFAFPDGALMLRREFDSALKQLLTFCGRQTSAFKGHSFRISAASAAALRGESDAQIRAAGRWASDAFRKYTSVIENCLANLCVGGVVTDRWPVAKWPHLSSILDFILFELKQVVRYSKIRRRYHVMYRLGMLSVRKYY